MQESQAEKLAALASEVQTEARRRVRATTEQRRSWGDSPPASEQTPEWERAEAKRFAKMEARLSR
jgi:hypothetical protein